MANLNNGIRSSQSSSMNSPEDLRDRLPLSSNRVGSVFLGDLQRHRHLSSPSSQSTHSTPTSSPPNTAVSGVFSLHRSHARHLSSSHRSTPSAVEDLDIDMDPPEALASLSAVTDSSSAQKMNDQSLEKKPGKIDPVLALELRLRWLEALILGVKQDLARDKKGKEREAEYASLSAAKSANLNRGETLVRLAQTVQQKLDEALEGNEGLKRFMNNYDQYSHLLTPSFALSGILPDPPAYDKMTPEEISSFLAEMEPDIRAADRDMLEINALEKKGVLGAGRLSDYEKLEPRLQGLLEAHEQNIKLVGSLEAWMASLVQRHATYVDTLSELFVAWDDAVTEAEHKLTCLEREKAERLRLGL